MADDLKILIVDDEPIIIRSCEAILKSEGYNVEGTLGAKKAILRMEQQPYDLVFTDLKMPEIDGITLIRWIKQKRPDTGIVIITGYPSQDTIKDALNCIIDYVPNHLLCSAAGCDQRAVERVKGKIPVEKDVKENFHDS
jgi:CheY-like chemotaxis protein